MEDVTEVRELLKMPAQIRQKTLSDLTYYVSRSVLEGDIDSTEAQFLLSHPVEGKRWLHDDLGIDLV